MAQLLKLTFYSLTILYTPYDSSKTNSTNTKEKKVPQQHVHHKTLSHLSDLGYGRRTSLLSHAVALRLGSDRCTSKRTLQLRSGIRIDHIIGQSDVRVSSALQRNRLLSEVFQHLVNGLEPKVLHSTLTLVVYSHS